MTRLRLSKDPLVRVVQSQMRKVKSDLRPQTSVTFGTIQSGLRSDLKPTPHGQSERRGEASASGLQWRFGCPGWSWRNHTGGSRPIARAQQNVRLHGCARRAPPRFPAAAIWWSPGPALPSCPPGLPAAVQKIPSGCRRIRGAAAARGSPETEVWRSDRILPRPANGCPDTASEMKSGSDTCRVSDDGIVHFDSLVQPVLQTPSP